MFSNLSKLGIAVPNGFAVTAQAYWDFLKETGLDTKIRKELKGLDTHNVLDLQRRGQRVRSLILQADFSKDLEKEILGAYKKLGTLYTANPDVAVRSSATAEDLPGASFAGQQETYLNVVGSEELLKAVKKAMASLFTNRAISYRVDKGFPQFNVGLSVGVQKMVRSDLASSGVTFTIDTETGFDKVVMINSSYGLGEFVVKGRITPDEFIVFKPTLKQGFPAIISMDLGEKTEKLVYAKDGTKSVNVAKKDRNRFSLTDKEILKLAKDSVAIEEYFSKKHKRYQPMDIEWAKDGKTGEMFIVQARPETVHSISDANVIEEYVLKGQGRELARGVAIGTKIASGRVRVIKDVKDIHTFQKDEILVTEMTDPDWELIMKIASAIVTDKGSRTSHAAIVSRELGIPAVVGTRDGTKRLKTGDWVTVDCSSGKAAAILKGKLAFEIRKHRLDTIPKTKTKIMVNIGSPDESFKNHYLPVKGVGLGRLEFIISSHIQIHPNALIDFPKLRLRKKTKDLAKKIENLTQGYTDKKQFYLDELAEGIAKIASTFFPHDVIIRFSDFKTNEYETLIGGELYEPKEENPMLGWRGASRYLHENFSKAFELECKAIKRVRDEFGLKNVVPMVPFCRTPEEGKKVMDLLKTYGLDRKKDKTLKIYIMCEIPSNILLADEFLDVFDGMSIGSNDLAQLTLGIDRDSAIVSSIANENNEAVKALIQQVIVKTKARKKYVGICGQAPSDYPEFARFLIKQGIESISLNPDAVIKTLVLVAKEEKRK